MWSIACTQGRQRSRQHTTTPCHCTPVTVTVGQCTAWPGASQLAQHEVRVVLRYQLLKQVKTTHFKLVSEKHPNFMPSLYTVVGGTRYTEEQVICNHALHSTLQLLAVSAPNTQNSNHTRHKSYHDRQTGCESTIRIIHSFTSMLCRHNIRGQDIYSKIGQMLHVCLQVHYSSSTYGTTFLLSMKSNGQIGSLIRPSLNSPQTRLIVVLTIGLPAVIMLKLHLLINVHSTQILLQTMVLQFTGFRKLRKLHMTLQQRPLLRHPGNPKWRKPTVYHSLHLTSCPLVLPNLSLHQSSCCPI